MTVEFSRFLRLLVEVIRVTVRKYIYVKVRKLDSFLSFVFDNLCWTKYCNMRVLVEIAMMTVAGKS